MKTNLLDFTLPALTEHFAAMGEKPFRAKQVMRWMHQMGQNDFDAMTDLAKSLRAKLHDTATVTVPSLNNDGSATVVTFTRRATTTLRFTVTSVTGSTSNVGLAEIEAYDGEPAGTPVAGPAPYSGPNVARNASVLASSEATGQQATKAIDSVIAGYPANAGAEWSTNGQRTGAWLQLYWSTAQQIDRVYLYDRPNGGDQVTGHYIEYDAITENYLATNAPGSKPGTAPSRVRAVIQPKSDGGQ